MASLARGQENTNAIVNWFLTLSGSPFNAYEVGFRVLDITSGLPGVQVFPAVPGDYEDVTAPPGRFAVGSYFAYDSTAGAGWTPDAGLNLGTHRVEWRWRDLSTSAYLYGQEDVEITASTTGGPAPLYISVQDVRDAGLTDDPPTDATILAAIALWQRFIERATRQWFYPRALVMRLDGTDSDALHFGVPIISVEYLKLNNSETALDPTLYRVYSADGWPNDRQNPRIKLIDEFNNRRDIYTSPDRGRVFRLGRQNQIVSGVFGYVEDDGSCPLLIKRALLKLVIEKLQQPLTAAQAAAAGAPPLLGAVIEEWTDGHKIKIAQSGGTVMDRAPGLAGITDDQEILNIIKLYRSPIGMATPAHSSYR